jgi:uncharacterized membrane protein YjjP (DUF1212 family)
MSESKEVRESGPIIPATGRNGETAVTHIMSNDNESGPAPANTNGGIVNDESIPAPGTSGETFNDESSFETATNRGALKDEPGEHHSDPLVPDEAEDIAENGKFCAAEMVFLSECRLAIALGLAAYKFGSGGSSVERLLNRIMTMRISQSEAVDSAVFRLSNAEMFCCIVRSGNHWPITFITDLKGGSHLDKLSKLACLLQDVDSGKCSLQDSTAVLQQIESDPDPYGFLLTGASWIFVGFGLPPVLGGTWWDALVGCALSCITFLVSTAFTEYIPARLLDPLNNVTIAFVAGVLSAAIKIAKPELNTNLTVLGAIAIPLPGYTISLGVGELVVGRIIPGMAHLIGGLVVLGWLLLGACLGAFIVERAADVPSYTGDINVVPAFWQALFVPLLCVGLAIAFQNSYRDLPWSVLCQGLSYCIVVGFSYLPQDGAANNLGIVASSIVMTLFSNIWSRWKDKPTNILLLPSVVLQVSGTIGFRGILALGQGNTDVGMQEFLRMFLVALLIFLGVGIGMVVLPPNSII